MPENSKNVNNYSVEIHELSLRNGKFRIQVKIEI